MDGKKDVLSGISPDQVIVKRTLGGPGSREQLGAGILHKDGLVEDVYDRTFGIYALVYVLRGRGTYYDHQGRAYPLAAGSVFQRFPLRPHRTVLQPDSRWEEYFIDMGPELYRGLLSTRFIPGEVPVFSPPEESRPDTLFLEYLSELRHCPEQELHRMIPAMLVLMDRIFRLSRRGGRSDREEEMVDAARNYFRIHCGGRFSLENYCRENGWGYEHFRKAFHRITGLSPGQFIIRRRIDRACEWLLGTGLSIKEIGGRLGYPSPYEFSHQFKKITGASPREYRRMKG